MANIEAIIEQLVLAETERASDELLGATIASVYETPEQELLMDKLAAYMQQKDREIEQLCNTHYQDFVTSVDQVLKVRQDASQLKNNILSLNSSLQEAGRLLLYKVLAQSAAR